MARLTLRDAEIVRLVARFGQVSSGHVASLLFQNNASETPCRRTLARLVDMNYLHRVERRMAGGRRAGSGQYVYSLGLNGYRFITPKGGKFTPQRAVKWHSLAIADAYVSMVKAGLHITGFSTEPDSWREIEGIKVRPDMHVELMHQGSTRDWWLEIDMGSESQRDLADKMNNLLDAKDKSGVYETTRADGTTFRETVGMVPFPRIIFIVPDQHRLDEVKWVIKRIEGAGDVFTVVLAESFPQSVL